MADEQTQTQEQAHTSDGSQNTDTQAPAAKTFTQDDLDKIISKRLERERKTWQEELEAEKKRAQMTAEEQLKADLEAEKQRSKDAIGAARQVLVEARAESEAVALGVKPERVEKFLKLADFSEVGDGADGRPDRAAIKQAIEAVLTEFPEFKGAVTASVGSGSNPPSATGAVTPESFKSMSYTDKVALYQRDPELYNRLALA